MGITCMGHDMPGGSGRQFDRRFTLTRRALLAGAAGVALPKWAVASARELASVARSDKALGAEVSITVLHPHESIAVRAIDAAFSALRQVDRVMSLYRPDSEISRLNRDGELRNPHPFLVSVLGQAQDLAKQTDGAFDVTVQPLWRLYAEARKSDALPPEEAIQTALRLVGWKKLHVEPPRIWFDDKAMAITLNAIAQGFAADQAVLALRRHGIEHAMVNAGEIATIGRKPDGRLWTIGIQHPRAKDAYIALAKLDGQCMATTGDYATTFTTDRAYHHIFTPATGFSPRELASVTVIATRAAQADALATAICVMGRERGLNLIRNLKGVAAYLVSKEGRVVTTDNFPAA